MLRRRKWRVVRQRGWGWGSAHGGGADLFGDGLRGYAGEYRLCDRAGGGGESK